MGVLLLCGLVIVTGFILVLIWNTRSRKYYNVGLLYSAIMCWAFGGLAALICGASMIQAAIDNDLTTANFVERKAAIEYRLDQCNDDKNVIVNGGVYMDIVEYNHDLREYKKWAPNFWIGWFYASGPVDLDYIELPKSVP